MKFNILTRLILGYTVIMIFVFFMGGYGTNELKRLKNLSNSIAFVDREALNIFDRLNENILSQVGFSKKYSVSQDMDFFKQFEKIEKDVLKDIKELESLLDSPDKKEKLSQIKALYKAYLILVKIEKDESLQEIGSHHEEGQGETENITDEIRQKLIKITQMVINDRDTKIKSIDQIVSSTYTFFVFITLLAVFFGIFISFFNTNSISSPISVLKEKTKDIAQGKFEKITSIKSPPEIKELAEQFNIMCEQLDELDRLKQEFISHISHELRTPLTVIKEASSMLIEGVYADVPEKEQELLVIMKEDCERLIRSVNRILDLSRMEAKMMNYNFRQCDLIGVVQKIMLKLTPLAQKKNIVLESQYQPEVPLITIDKERIGQVVENLVGNALKFTSEEGRILVGASLLIQEKSFIKVTVSDTGTGIAQEDIEKIFDKFKRIERGKSTPHGTGLGLSICKHIIAEHGGEIWAKSKPGKGSTFYFILPVS